MTDRKQYLQVIKLIFPKVKEWEMLDHGWDHLVFKNIDFIVRFPKESTDKKLFLREYKFVSFFNSRFNFNIPKMTLYDNLPNGLIAVSYPVIRGEQLTPKYLAKLDEKEQNKIAGELGKFFSDLHGVNYQEVLHYGYEPVDQLGFASYIEKRIESLGSKLFQQIPSEMVEIITDVSQIYINSVREHSFPLAVTHADIQGEHMFHNGSTQRSLGIIDFGDVRINDPAYDFGFLNLYSEGFYSDVLENYNFPIDEDFNIRSKFNAIRFLVNDLDEQFTRGANWKESWHYQALVDLLTNRF